MPRQGSFAEAEYAGKKRQTRRDKACPGGGRGFWPRWSRSCRGRGWWSGCGHYTRKGERGWPPIGLERMLRVYFVQQWYGLSDEGLEDALYDSQALRGFAGIALNRDAVPDATRSYISGIGWSGTI